MTADRAAALEGALRRLLTDNDHWIYDAADRAKHSGECRESEALCDAIDHARTVLNAGAELADRIPQTPWQNRVDLDDLPGRLQENSNPEAGRCWLETTDGGHVAEFNVTKIGAMESVVLAQELARLWNRIVPVEGGGS